MKKETLLMSSQSQLLAMLVLGSLLAPSHQEAGDFTKWVTLQQTSNVGQSAGGGKDPQLTAAEASRVNNGIEPDNSLGAASLSLTSPIIANSGTFSLSKLALYFARRCS